MYALMQSGFFKYLPWTQKNVTVMTGFIGFTDNIFVLFFKLFVLF